MMIFLKILFAIVFLTMVGVTSHAQSQIPIWKVSENVTHDPWFIATLFDAYFGFVTFYCWVFYKERSILGKFLWFILIMLGGNMAMAAYMLVQLFRIPSQGTAEDLLLNQHANASASKLD